MKPRHGAVSTTLLTVAGVLGLGAAVASLTTGVTPCSLMSSCDTGKATAATAVTVADAEALSSCNTGEAVAMTVAASSDGATACESEAVATNVASSDCGEKTACDEGAKATTVANASDCGEKAACEGEAVAMTVAAGDCGSESACEGDAKAMTVATGDCGEKAGACGEGNTAAVAASSSDCGSKAGCESDATPAVAMTVAADAEACGGECAEGDAKALPVAAHAFNAECPYSGNPVKANVVSAHYGMDVHFCCAGCKSRFDKAEVETRTELVRGVVEPINDTCCGKPVDASTTAVVQGFPVAFCKPACGEMVRSADDQKQINFVASKINYVNAECCGKPTADAKLVGFHKGKAVAFNGAGCAEKFNAMSDREKTAYVKKVSAGQSEPCGDATCADQGCKA